MTLPMVTCPLCCRPGFSTSEALCSSLLNVTTRKLCCPICNYVVIGLDKFTIHLITHSLNKYGLEDMKDSVQMCQPDNENMATVKNVSSCDDSVRLESVTSHNLSKNFVKLQNSINKELCFKGPDKQDLKISSPVVQNELQKLNIPDTSVICFHTDNGQMIAISSDGLAAKNVTINTQNYITNTNITTNTVQTKVFEKVQKRKYSQVFERDHTEIFNKAYDQESPDNYSNLESVNSWSSTPSVSSETDKQTVNTISEREFESCKDLLTKGDFSTLTDDISEIEVKKEGRYSERFSNSDIFDSKKNDLKKNNLSCEQCPYVFPNKTILAMHKQLIHKKVEVDVENKRKLLVCNLCPRTFSLRSSLMIHRKVAHAGGFGNSENGNNSKQTPVKPACHICGKFFKKEIHLTQHMKAHDEKQWQCTICSKTFTTKYFLKKHRRLHTGETPYKCNTCSKSFTFQQSYHKHLLYHNDEKPYCCAQCGRLFKELSTLHNHERIHSGEKPFSCETCGKAFRQRVSYLVHRRIHTGAMPYQCTACNKRFRYKISQRTHKCSVDPPGVVVRTNGSLVERLQAAMIKAAVEVDKDKTKNEVNEENYFEADKLLSRSQNFSSNLDPPICNPTSFSSQSKQMASSSMHNTTGLQYTKASDAEKTVPDKPQIYLLVKGPNEETYYQPLLLSQNSNIFVNNNNNTLSSQKNKLDNVKSKTKKKNDLAINVEQLLTNYVEISNLSEKNKSFALEKEKDLPETMDENTEQVIKSSFHWFINGKKPNNKTEPPHELSTGVVNMLSEDSAMNDIISSLSCELSEAQSNPGSETNFHEVITSKSDYNSDTMMMDSTDIFSLVINPSLYSPSEGLGRLSLSPNTIAHQSMTDHHNDSSEAVKNNFSSNDEQQDSLFDNISDDALKELLFGSPE